MNLYKFGKRVVSIALFPVYRVKVLGKENIPKEGPVIICSNHISNLDPPVVGMTCPRDIYFMAKEELFSKPILRALMVRINAFPIKRGMKDRNALRKGLEVLSESNVLGLFPEGTRSKTGEVKEGLAGAGFFAVRSNAQIVPCAIIGPYQVFRQLKVVYGKPIDMDEFRANKSSAKEVTDTIMEEIKKLVENHR
ncbi:1-acyl-sn-glycerol-3-phosphate acyltransferase [Aquibacillus sp. 3ASR75-11]|uniref:1-acyl-sn-glycerol-3-phosphate acyltransferase n=1 Tax=Terrihalobacillus insolitus TaxID=2950438 RepID=A0A9X4AMG3_9BACI|nr:lysophospholipid acyltransferase family protein [Terrihalobacillus insolitus]MDC3413067.1 1-acyl-sn-glycerol-3-phosphate acyltransferase [Terrihalobacillus insolitus]MDC3424809.1 1-acyl-sn-glycerol-3-phosphate acyltransferase [Terrihalobacillus insolitus]